MNKVLTYIKQYFCKHKFNIQDIKNSLIEYPNHPDNTNYHDWQEYYKQLYTCDAHYDVQLKRTCCPCKKCGKIFYANVD